MQTKINTQSNVNVSEIDVWDSILYVQYASMYSDSSTGVKISTFVNTVDIQMQLLELVIIQKPSLHLESGKLGCFPGVAVEENWVCVKLQDSWYFAKV